MKRIIVFILVSLVLAGQGSAQVKVYKGTSQYTSDVICHVEDGKVYKKNSSYTADILCHVKGTGCSREPQTIPAM